MLLERSLEIDLNYTMGQQKNKTICRNTIITNLQDCQMMEKLPMISRQSDSEFIIEAENILYLMQCYE